MKIYKDRDFKYMETCEYIEEHDDVLYVANASIINETTRNSPIFNIDEHVSPKNLISLGGWSIYSPKYYYIVNKYNVPYKQNVILSLAESSNMYYITQKGDYRYEMLIKYIEEHTGHEVESIKIKEFPDADIEIYDLKLKESAND